MPDVDKVIEKLKAFCSKIGGRFEVRSDIGVKAVCILPRPERIEVDIYPSSKGSHVVRIARNSVLLDEIVSEWLELKDSEINLEGDADFVKFDGRSGYYDIAFKKRARKISFYFIGREVEVRLD